MTRTDAREYMMQVFFEMEACNDYDVNSRESHLKRENLGAQKDYCHELFSLICNKKEQVDKLIVDNNKSWKLSRIPKTDLAILRVSMLEILYMDSVPDAVSINEAVDLAKKYGTESSPSYINAILGQIVKTKRD